MQAKKPVRMISCPKCKGGDFHYNAGAKLASNEYKCNACGYVVRG